MGIGLCVGRSCVAAPETGAVHCKGACARPPCVAALPLRRSQRAMAGALQKLLKISKAEMSAIRCKRGLGHRQPGRRRDNQSYGYIRLHTAAYGYIRLYTTISRVFFSGGPCGLPLCARGTMGNGTGRHLSGTWAPTGRTGIEFRPGWFAQMPAYARLCLLVPAFFRKFYSWFLHAAITMGTRQPKILPGDGSGARPSVALGELWRALCRSKRSFSKAGAGVVRLACSSHN